MPIESIPVPDAAVVGALAFGVLIGLSIPTGYGLERLAGFGRAAVSKLPYKPPAGMKKEEALARTSEAAGDTPAEPDEQDGGK